MPLLIQDRALLDAFRRGDRSALARVYRHFAPRLLRQVEGGLRLELGEQTVRANVGGWFEAEAIVQETFARAFVDKARLAYDGLRPFGGFLVGIARNVLVDEYRRHHRALARFVPLEDDGGHEVLPAEAAPGPDKDTARAQEHALVAEFLSSSSPEELAIYRALYEDDLSQEAAARRCGISRMKLRWVERKLRKRFLAFAKRRGLLDGEHARRGLPLGKAVLTVLW